jgi:hypothetical protein
MIERDLMEIRNNIHRIDRKLKQIKQ